MNCCITPYEGYDVRLNWPDATDDVASAVVYNVYRRDEATSSSMLVAAFLPPGGMSGMVPTGRAPPTAWMLKYGTYSVRAVDWAGNEDANESTLELSPDDVPKPAAGSFGCSVAGAPGPSALGLAALLLALAATAAARPASAASPARRG
jgi:hypothetical protein